MYRIAFAILQATLVLVNSESVSSAKQFRVEQTNEIKRPEREVVKTDPQSDRLKSIESTLVKFGVEPNIESIREYLRSLLPTDNVTLITKKWIKLLENSSYEQREEASKNLIRMPVIRNEMLLDLLEHGDLEVAYRAKVIKAAREKHVTTLKVAALGFIVETQAKNLISDILAVYDQFADSRVIRLANQAIEVTASKSDLGILETCLDQYKVNQDLATGSLNAIQRLDSAKAIQWIITHRDELKNDRFKVQCAAILAKNEQSECLDLYLDLLAAEELRNRSLAYSALRGMVDRRFGYSVTLAGDPQTAAVTKWRQYIADNRSKIEIKYELSRPRLGRLLVCSYSTGKVTSFDEQGKIKWTADGKNTFTCQGLPSGNCLVMFYTVGTLVEYDENGKVVKTISGLPTSASGIQRLENGHTLLAAGQSGNKIVEIDAEGKEVWSTVLDGTPTGARMQENGLILVSLYGKGKLVEIDRKGKIVNEITVKGKPYTAQRLEDGKILVAFASGGVAEYLEDGTELWRAKTESNTYWADLLEDGTIITADKTGILRFDRKGKLISRDASFTNYTYLSAY